jgi:hypothetical protein
LLTLQLTGQKKNHINNLVANTTVRKLVQSGWKVMQGIENSAKGSGKFLQSSEKVLQSSEKVLQSSGKVLQSSGKVPQSRGNLS